MTKEDLDNIANKNEEDANQYVALGNNVGASFCSGYAMALRFVLRNFSELCDNFHQDKLERRAMEEARFYIREYFQDKYNYEWTTDEIEARIQRALDEGDVETIANSFMDSVDDGIPDDEWCSNIVRNFYD